MGFAVAVADAVVLEAFVEIELVAVFDFVDAVLAVLLLTEAVEDAIDDFVLAVAVDFTEELFVDAFVDDVASVEVVTSDVVVADSAYASQMGYPVSALFPKDM